MDGRHSNGDREEVKRDLLQKMADSGYSHEARREVIASATRKYCRQLMNQMAGGQRIYRTSAEMATSRSIKDFLNTNWFKSKRGGKRITESKDVPSHIRLKEDQAREESRKGNKATGEHNKPGNGRDDVGPAEIKEIETVVFLPATPGSRLKKDLQEADEILCKTTNSPTVRFVERGGPTLMELVGKSNPWSREWFCPRKNCVPCKGRLLLAAEDAEERLQMAEKKEGVVKRSQESRVAVPSCTGEGVNYILECAACRKSGKQVAYYGETSRSAFQRGLNTPRK